MPNGIDHVLVLTPALALARIHLQLDPRLAGKELDRFVEVQSLGVLDEGVDVAAFAAPEAVVETASQVEIEGRGLLLMKWAHRGEGSAALLDRGHRPDQVGQVGTARTRSMSSRRYTDGGSSSAPTSDFGPDAVPAQLRAHRRARADLRRTAPSWLLVGFLLMNLLVLLEVADRLSLKRDLEVAREIQQAMLPDGHVVGPWRRGLRPDQAGQHGRRRLLRHPAAARRHASSSRSATSPARPARRRC